VSPDTLFVLGAAVVGLAIGSFLNVVIHRYPRMMEAAWRAQCAELDGKEPPAAALFNLWIPRSHCPSCKKTLAVTDNIPVFSYAILRGRCRYCRAPISGRYPLVETLTAVLSAAVAWKFGFGLAAGFALVFTWLLIALTFIDLDTQFLPFEMTSLLFWLGFVATLLALYPWVSLRESVLGALVGYFSLWSLNALYKLVRGRVGMGDGDFALLAGLGAWMGVAALLPIVLLASAVGAIVGITQNLLARRGVGLEVAIPFGPYLAGAGMIMLLAGPAWSKWIMPL